MWSSLESWEYRFIDFFGDFLTLTNQYKSSTRSSEGLMCSRCDDIKSIVKWIFQCFSSNESGDMRHICHRDSTNFFRDLDELRIIELSRIRRESREDDLRLRLVCDSTEVFIVDLTCFWVFHLISDKVKNLRNIRHRMPVSEVSAMREIHPEDGITWLTESEICSDIGWCTRMSLDICIFRIKESTGSLDTKFFYLISKLLATVVATMWISLGVFICKDRAHSLVTCTRDIVF